MKKLNRLLLAILSSLLLTAGFSRAAGILDPMTADLSAHPRDAAHAAPDTSSLCSFDESGK